MPLDDRNTLQVSRPEADQKLLDRIQKGEAIRKTFPQRADSREAFQRFYEDVRLWSDYNRQLLSSLFSSQQILLEYANSQSPEGPLGELRKKIICLKSIRDRLELIPEGADTEKNHYSASNLDGLHPEIYSKCNNLFTDGAYAEAVEKGFKVVRDRLRQLTGHETGSEAFGKGKLHIRGATAPHVDEDFNEGVKFLTMAIDRFRNEKSHTSDAQIKNPARAYEYLGLSSLAMHLLDEAEVLENEK